MHQFSFFKQVTRGHRLERHFAQNHVAVHHKIAHQAVQRVLKRCRAVLFEEEVPDPGKAVAGDRHGQQQAQRPSADGIGQNADHQRGADEMQAPAGAVAVLAQVVRVELGEAVELFDVFHDGRPLGGDCARQMFGGELI